MTDLIDRIENVKNRIETEKDTYEESIGVAHTDFEREQRKGIVKGMERALTIINEELTRPEEEEEDDELDLFEEYKEDIRKFFAEDEEVWTGSLNPPDRERNGMVWIAKHPNIEGNKNHFETLTVEPEQGGQYEIAVRWKGYDGKWSGYSISHDNHLIGHNTRGH